jgi:hypothetical protein
MGFILLRVKPMPVFIYYLFSPCGSANSTLLHIQYNILIELQ